MKRKWLVIPALAALLVTGAIAGTAFAQSESDDDSSPVSRFVEILADKLGVGEEELQTAVEETKEELQAERKAAWEQQLRDKLAAMVEEGAITQEQPTSTWTGTWTLRSWHRASSARGSPSDRGHHRGKRGGFRGTRTDAPRRGLRRDRHGLGRFLTGSSHPRRRRGARCAPSLCQLVV